MNSSITAIKDGLAVFGIGGESLPVCEMAPFIVTTLMNEGRFDDALRSVEVISLKVRNMTTSNERADGGGADLFLRAGTGGCGALSLGGIANALSKIAADLTAVVLDNENVVQRAPRLAAQVVKQTTQQLAQRQEAQTVETIGKMADLASAIVKGSSADKLSNVTGQQTALALSDLAVVSKNQAHANVGSDRDAWVNVTKSISGAVNTLLENIGSTQTDMDVETKGFTASVRAVFLDSEFAVKLPLSNTTVHLPPVTEVNENVTRNQATLAVVDWETSLDLAREEDTNGILNGAGHPEMLTPIVSVTVKDPIDGRAYTNFSGGNVTLQFGELRATAASVGGDCPFTVVTTCEFWDTKMLVWSTKGCKLKLSNLGPQCICNHLTEFTVMRRQKTDCKASVKPWR
jgi:hypothetical protein